MDSCRNPVYNRINLLPGYIPVAPIVSPRVQWRGLATLYSPSLAKNLWKVANVYIRRTRNNSHIGQVAGVSRYYLIVVVVYEGS